MGADTKVEWCDHTKSPWHGCRHAKLPDGTEHPGCLHCYAETMSRINPTTLGKWGGGGTRVVDKTFHKECRRWNAAAAKAGVQHSVFPSICDPFEDWPFQMYFSEKDDDGRQVNSVAWWTPKRGVVRAGLTSCGYAPDERLASMDDCRRELFATIDDCPWLNFLLLTKRPQNVLSMWPDCAVEPNSTPHSDGRSNAWLGTSVSDQATAAALIPDLLNCRDLSPVLFLSVEPLLGPVDLSPWLSLIDWVIVGGESGRGVRPCEVGWIDSIVEQCKAAEVRCFVKQLGSHAIVRDAETANQPVCLKLNDPKGGDMSEWPIELRVREMPAERDELYVLDHWTLE